MMPSAKPGLSCPLAMRRHYEENAPYIINFRESNPADKATTRIDHIPLPANVAVAIYLPKQVREFRSVFRSASGFQTTDSVQLGNTFEETTLESARHFFNTSFMYEAAGTPGYGLLIAMHPNVKSEDRPAPSHPPRALPPLHSTR